MSAPETHHRDYWQHPQTLQLAAVMTRPLEGPRSYSAHSHPFHELGLVIEGRCSWKLDNTEIAMEAGSLLLVPAGQSHQEIVADGECARLAWLGFESETPPPELCAPLAAGTLATEFRRRFETIFAEHRSSALAGPERAALALREVLLLLCRLTENQPIGQAGRARRHEQIVRAIAHTLTENLANPPSVEVLAGYHSISPGHLATLFQRHLGVTPHAYLTSERMRRAEELLQSGAKSVKEIARICGFVDAPHFCRAYKNATGRTPGATRTK